MTEPFKPDPSKLDDRQWEAKMAAYHAEWERRKIDHEATIKFADIAIRSLLVLNGGAAFGALAFAGQSLSSGNDTQARALAELIIPFGSGAGLAVTCAAASYLAQMFFTSGSENTLYIRIDWVLQVFAMLIYAAGLVSFGYRLHVSSSVFGSA